MSWSVLIEGKKQYSSRRSAGVDGGFGTKLWMALSFLGVSSFSSVFKCFTIARWGLTLRDDVSGESGGMSTWLA